MIDSIKKNLQASGFLINEALGEVTLETDVAQLKSVLHQLREHVDFSFEMLIDLCAVDYLTYGQSEWETQSTTEHGFSRGVVRDENLTNGTSMKSRFAVVYHLLSIKHNQRLRVKAFLKDGHETAPSVHDLWKAADWYEREAYDLYGIVFEGHPDLRRILTDYGFIGHPFRKDFPLSGYVEMRYDAKQQKVIYEPVDIEPRTSVPKVIRQRAN